MTRNRLYRSVSLIAALTLSAPALVRAGADEGKALYDKQCQSCHSIKGQGGKMAALGGPLDGVGAKRDAAWIKDYLKDPKSKMPNAKMPKVTVTDPQLDDLVAYMMTLK